MECEDDGYVCSEAAAADVSLGVKRRRHAAEGNVQLDVTIAVPSASNRKPMDNRMVSLLASHFQKIKPSDTPFMNNMDEITYWVHTKRAPCLYTYDQTSNKDQAHCSKFKPKNNVLKEVPSPKKKNKRKLALSDDDTISTEQEPIANFFTSDGQHKTVKNNGKVSSIVSDIDFIIQESPTEIKPKRMRLERKSKANLVQKFPNNIASSTPKVGAVRRSLRKLQKQSDKSQLDSSVEILNNNAPPDNPRSIHIAQDATTELPENVKKTDSKGITATNQSCNNVNEKSKLEALNGQFEDVSDVSGFTANYIRSTKMLSAKTSRNLRNKLSKNYIKQSQKEGGKTVMCVNKSVNTGLPDSTVLNCSTDSSQNIINVVTLKSNEKSAGVDRGTSLLKFVDTKHSDCKESLVNNDSKELGNVNVSIKSNGTSRYPKRRKNNTADGAAPIAIKVNQSRSAPGRRKRTCKNSSECNNSDRKENPADEIVTRTRSGRKIGLKVSQAENSVLVLSNSTEQLSSTAAVNVAGPAEGVALEDTGKKTRRSGRCARMKKPAVGGRQLTRKDSLKDKSGFLACFSDSDDDTEPVKQRKFFC